MIGLVFATIEEAAPLIDRIEAKQITSEPFPSFQFSYHGNAEECILFISGVGKVAAALATQFLIQEHQPSVIINAGICGAATNKVKVGEVYQVTEAIEGDLYQEFSKPQQCDPLLSIWSDLPKARLTTRDIPVYDEQLRSQIAEWGELVDMEGAAVVRTCNLHGIPGALLKGVTDFADTDGKEDIKKNIDMVAKKIAEVLCQGLKNLGNDNGKRCN